MARGAAFAGSLVAHAIALAIVLVARIGPERADPPGDPPALVAIEVVAAAHAEAPTKPVPPVVDRGAPAAPGRATLPGQPRLARSSGAMAARAGRPAAAAPDAIAITVRIESGDGRGDAGDGGSSGRGNGIGFGAGGGIGPPAVELLRLSTPEPRAPPVSRARPPRLIYPARNREVEDSLFVAHLTIDNEGFVVGARLMRGVGGSRDDQAASAVWRFRYSPALDDDGRPIAAAIDQPFLLD